MEKSVCEVITNKENCFGCGVCAQSCEHCAISMRRDSEGFVYPVVDSTRCVGCGRCITVCPYGKEHTAERNRYFLLRIKDENTLRASSSGGAFSVLSDAILSEGGLVCGAEYDSELHVVHALKTDYSGMRKSKYVQSDTSAALKEMEGVLKSGKSVLFSGTPCQCHGVRLLFPKYAERLLTVSVICRGVSSPGFWEDYLEYLSEHYGAVSKVDFREKKSGGNGRFVSYEFKNGTEAVNSVVADPFMCIYSKTLCYRPSCYSCPYTAGSNDFDFTIGDAWNAGGESFANDGKGMSLVITHTSRAEYLLEQVMNRADIREIDPKECTQPALKAPAKMTILRKLFFQDIIAKTDMEIIIKKYGKGVV